MIDTKKLLKTLGLIACIILLATLLVKHTTQGETLLDYAGEHPELAYATPQISPDPSADDEAAADDMEDFADSTSLTTVSPSPEITDKSASDTILEADTSLPQSSFYYTELTSEVKRRITGISYPVYESTASAALNVLPDTEVIQISYGDLRYLKVLYYDFNGEVQEGELICNHSIAEDLKEIFYELYLNEYQIESIRLIDDFDGDDAASMEANNTSCFNYRVVDGTTSLSKHALGCAIDINPFYNPYIVFDKTGSGQDYISPAGSEIYADRSKAFPYKIDENDLCYRLFKEHGFTWGGDWNSCKDYQHFQKVS